MMCQNQILQFCNANKILGEEIINTLQNGSRRIPPWIIAPPPGQFPPRTIVSPDNAQLGQFPPGQFPRITST